MISMVDGIAIMNNHDHSFGGSTTTAGSATVTSPSSSTTQQTFTTAGTPYRPGVPNFQRPERRNRYRTDDGVHNGLSLLPKHDMHRVLANGGLVGGSVPQYTPLQQNNDRAANPAKSLDRVSPSMGSGSPTTGSARSQIPPPDFGFGASTSSSHHGIGTYNDEHIDHDRVVEYGSDDDAAFTKNPLRNMNVKSIQNLASYTNPQQDNARKLLAHKARMALNGLAQSNGGPAGSSETRNSFRFGEQSVSPTHKYSTRTNGLDDSPVPFGVAQYAKRMHAGPSNSGRTRNLGFHLADGYEDNQPSSTILAPGPGAPRPLTAGLLGQRRLSMSGFNTTDKEWRSREVDIPFGQLGPGPRYSLYQGGVEQLSLPYKSGASVDPAGSATTGDWPRGLEKAGAYNQIERPSDNITEEAIDDFSTPMNDGAGDQMSFDWNYQYTETSKTYYGMQTSHLGVMYEHGTGRMTKETVQARADKINSDWYSGANIFSQPGLTLPRETAEKYGFNKPSSSMAGAMPRQYGQLGIKDANRMSIAELGAPLVDVMLAKLACFIAEEKEKCTSTTRGPSFWPIE